MCVQPLSIQPRIQAHTGGALPTPGAAPPTSVKPITRSSSSVAGGWSADSSLRVLSQVIGFLSLGFSTNAQPAELVIYSSVKYECIQILVLQRTVRGIHRL